MSRVTDNRGQLTTTFNKQPIFNHRQLANAVNTMLIGFGFA